MSSLDDKIKEVLDQVDRVAPQPPGFNNLRSEPSRPTRRLVSVAAAAALLVAGVVGIVILNNNDSGTTDQLPAIEPTNPTQLPTTVSEPVPSTQTSTVAPAETTATTPSTTAPSPVAPSEGQLLTTPVDAGSIPYLVIDDASITRVYSDRWLAVDNGFERFAAVVGEGPTYDAPLLVAFVTSEVPTGGGFGTEGVSRTPTEILESMYGRIGETEADGEGVIVVEVDVAGRRGVAEIRASDPDTKLGGPIVTLRAPLDDETVLVVNSTRLTVDEAAAIASTIDTGPEGVSLPTPAGYTELSAAPTYPDNTFVEYQYELDGRQIQVTASNRGTEGLLGRILTEVRTNRVVANTDVAYRPLPDSPGRHWADWALGDWSFYVDAFGFANEQEFLAVLSRIELTDEATVEAQLADGVSIVEGISAFCGTYAALQGEQPESYVGSDEHVADISEVLDVAPESVVADLGIFRDYLSSGAVDAANDPESTTAENWPPEVQTAITNAQSFAAENC